MADIDFGQLSEALNDKADTDLRNVDTTAKADAVIDYQEPTSSNGYTWYRKYKSGWVEQGGVCSGSGYQTINLPTPMADGNYTALTSIIAPGSSISNPSAVTALINQRNTTTLVVLKSYGNGGQAGEDCLWQVSGMAA